MDRKVGQPFHSVRTVATLLSLPFEALFVLGLLASVQEGIAFV